MAVQPEKKFTNWTYDDAKQIASQYDNLKKFTDEQPNAANVIYRNKWNDLLTHMERGFKWWTDDEIIQDASKYGSRSEWQKNSGSAYNAALSRGILDQATRHMKYLGNLHNRAVYVWEFPDKSVYVGLTLNLDRRKSEHNDLTNNTAVSKHIKLTGLIPEYKIISDEYINSEDAQNLENCTIEEYRGKGWKVLNIAKIVSNFGPVKVIASCKAFALACACTCVNK